MSTQKIEIQKKLSIIDFYQFLFKEDKEITENHLLWNSCPFTLSSEDKKNLMDALNKKTKLDTERSLFEKKLKEFNVSTETVSFSEYEKILPLSRLAYAFEKNGEAEAHAFKLILLFGSKAAVLDYLKKFERDNPDLTQLIHDACLFPLPQGDKWNIKIWRELSIKYMPDNRYNRVLGRAIEIENYINKEKGKIENEIDEQVDRDWKEKFEKRFLEIMTSDLSEENKYISTKLEKLNSKMNVIINKRFDFYIREEIIQNSIIKKLSFDEIKKIRDYKNSSSGIEKLKQIKEEVIIEFKNTLKKEYQTSKNCFNLDKKTYIEKCFQENQKLMMDEKRLRKKDIFSENTGLDFLLNLNANCSYKRANEHLAAAKLFLQHGLSGKSFELYLTLKKQDSDLIPPLLNKDEIPILIEGKEIGYPGFYLTKLSPENPICAVLGKLTSCCQHLDGAGKKCAIHAITSEQGGLYILCSYKKNVPTNEDPIIAQCWAWRSQNGAIIFDSVEILVHLREKYERMISDFFTYWGHTLVKNYNIPRVSVGTGGITPKILGSVEPLEPEFPNDYNEYRDSKNQRIIADKLLPFVDLYLNSNQETGKSKLCIKLKTENAENLMKETKIKEEEAEKNSRLFSEWCTLCAISEKERKNNKIDFSLIYDRLSKFDLTKEKADNFFLNTKRYQKLLDDPGDFVEIVQLSKQGIYPFTPRYNYTVLMQASKYGDTKIVSELLETNAKETINKTNHQESALIFAAIKENPTMISLLLKHGADTSIKNCYGETALILSAKHGHFENFSILFEIDQKNALNNKDNFGKTILICAVLGGNNNIVSILIKADIASIINAKDNEGGNALLYAASKNNFKLVEMLLKENADANIQDNSGDTPLMFACKHGNSVMIAALLKSGIDTINFRNNLGYSALLYACQFSNAASVELLLKSGANTFTNEKEWGSFQTNPKKTALMYAAEKEDTEKVLSLLNHGAKSTINDETDAGNTALMYGVGNDSIVSILLKNGAKINHANSSGRTALMWTARKGNVKSIHILLEASAEINRKDWYDQSELMLAARYNNTKAFFTLLKFANANSLHDKNKDGETTLMYAAKHNNKEILEHLIKLQVEINIKDDDGATALMWAIEKGHELIVERLIKEGADHSIEANSGHTPLTYATLHGKPEIVLSLLRARANVNLKNKRGSTALIDAAFWGRTQIASILLQTGADLNMKDEQGNTALTIAKKFNNQDIVTMLENAHAIVDQARYLHFKALNPLSSYFKHEQPDTAEPFFCKLRMEN